MRLAAGALLCCFLSAGAQQLRGVPVENIDRTVNACNDFDAYANGAWRAAHPMPAYQSAWAIRQVTQDETLARLRTIAEEDEAKAATLSRDSAGELTGDFYGSCMDTAARDAADLKGLEPLRKRIAAVKDAATLDAAMAELATYKVAAPAQILAMQDLHDTTHMIAEIDVDSVGMPDREYYLRDEARYKRVRDAYVPYVQSMFKLMGSSDADAAAAAVMKIETGLSQARMTLVEMRDPKTQDNAKTLAELKTLAPHFDWAGLFRAYHVPTTGHMNVDQPKQVQAFDALLTSASPAEWKAYLQWRLVDTAGSALPDKYETAWFGFHGTVLTGVKQQREPWQRCVQATDKNLGEALGHEYVDRYLPPEAKARARQMAVNIVNELKLSIQSRDWMTAPTKAKALEKVDALNIKVGYPDRWKSYAGVLIDRKDFLASNLSTHAYAVRDDVQQIGRPVDRGRWDMTPPTMNAYYNPLMNEIVVPAGYLQPPGFDPKGIDAINYGGVGISIGHEISHGVDDEGAQFAADGRLMKWWTDADYKNFEERTACTTKQYDSYYIEPEIHLQGKLVTGEALGDLGGANLALRAYHRSREGKGPEPTVGGFTPDQQFFLAEAEWRGTIVRPEAARTAAATDPHPPGHFRVLGPLSNMPEFQQAFQCKEGDAMVRPVSDRCTVW